MRIFSRFMGFLFLTWVWMLLLLFSELRARVVVARLRVRGLWRCWLRDVALRPLSLRTLFMVSLTLSLIGLIN